MFPGSVAGLGKTYYMDMLPRMLLQVPCIYATLEKRSFKRMRCAILAAMGLCMFIYTVQASGLTEKSKYST